MKHEKYEVLIRIKDTDDNIISPFLFLDIAKKLVIELVESESIVDYKIAIEFIKRVKSKGCKIAIDDFGSGYSNFEYLVKLEADYIKIDGSLIKNIVTQKSHLP